MKPFMDRVWQGAIDGKSNRRMRGLCRNVGDDIAQDVWYEAGRKSCRRNGPACLTDAAASVLCHWMFDGADIAAVMVRRGDFHS